MSSINKRLSKILELNDNGYVKRRESTTLEFKENFNRGQLAAYAKTMAAFANNRGGIIVFGVSNSPKLPVGLSNDTFFKLDPEKLTNELNKTFQPEIIWRLEDISIENRRFGFIIVEESFRKPVIAKINKGDKITEGAIFYRYNARSELIKYSEMTNIIESVREKEQKLWLNHIKQISHIGVENAGIFNPDDGLIKGSSGSFIIDKSLLPSLQFIKEGQFVEKDGAPSIKLIGNAHVIGSEDEEYNGVIGIQEKAINQNDIIVNYLNNIKVRSPKEYLKQICLEGLKYLPFYYYCHLADIKIEDLGDFFESIHGYSIILTRLKSDSSKLPVKLKNTGTSAFKAKKRLRKELLKGSLTIPPDKKNLRYLLFVLRSLEDIDIIRETLLEIYKKPLRKIQLLGDFRLAVCYLDYIENKS